MALCEYDAVSKPIIPLETIIAQFSHFPKSAQNVDKNKHIMPHLSYFRCSLEEREKEAMPKNGRRRKAAERRRAEYRQQQMEKMAVLFRSFPNEKLVGFQLFLGNPTSAHQKVVILRGALRNISRKRLERGRGIVVRMPVRTEARSGFSWDTPMNI